jgi:hypothetical protein
MWKSDPGLSEVKVIADNRNVYMVEEPLAWIEKHNLIALTMDPIF